MIGRRTLIGSAAGSMLTAPLAGTTQPTRKVYRIGILTVGFTTAELAGPEPRPPTVAALLRGLRELGYAYGEHFVTEARSSEGQVERFAALSAELVRLQVDVIVATGPSLAALKQATSTIPIVMTAASLDPVDARYVQSLGRPGRNFTGLSLLGEELTGKRLELLKQLVPGAAPVAVLWDPGAFLHWQAAEAAARERGWKLLSLEVRDAGEIEGAFKAATGARAGALLATSGAVLFPQTRRVAELAAKNRLPAIYELRPFVDAGGLMSYGADINDIWRRAAVYVDKILKGAKPADLPVEQPTKFELVINLKSAKALGLTIPQTLLLRADQLIE